MAAYSEVYVVGGSDSHLVVVRETAEWQLFMR